MQESKNVIKVKHTTDFLGREWSYNCMGCSIREGEITPPGGCIYNGKSFFVQQDPEVPVEGFLIVNAKEHIRSIAELTKEERIEMIELINISINAIKDLGLASEVTVVQEERSKHLHVWVYPTTPWMVEKFGKGITYLRAINEYVKENATGDNINKVMTTIEKMKEYFKNVGEI